MAGVRSHGFEETVLINTERRSASVGKADSGNTVLIFESVFFMAAVGWSECQTSLSLRLGVTVETDEVWVDKLL